MMAGEKSRKTYRKGIVPLRRKNEETREEKKSGKIFNAGEKQDKEERK
jgi:hypothetical protein